MEYDNDIDIDGLLICPWCGQEINEHEPTAVNDNDLMHLTCAIADQDNSTFDRDMGF